MSIYKVLKSQVWAILWTIVILILCNMKTKSGGGFFFQGFDKMVHLGFFYILTVLLFFGRIRTLRTYRFGILTILKIIFVSAFLGGLVEILQWKVFTYRSAEWWDFVCDMLGCLMAVFSYILWHQWNNNHEKKD